jgi:hypothetical protein
MRYLGWSAVVAAALVASGCGSSGDDDGSGTGRNGNGGPGRMITGSGGSTSPKGGGLFGNPNGAPTMGASGSQVPNEDDITCAKSHITATRVIPTVMLLLDGSQSMTACYGPDNATPAVDGGTAVVCPPDDSGGLLPPPPPPGAISRWDAIRRAVADPTIGVVSALQDRVMFGVAVFGTQPQCPLPLGVIDPALNNFNAIAGAVPVQPPGTYTPTGVALEEIVKKLPDPVNDAIDKTIGPQIVVLATDGDPNACEAVLGIPTTDYGPSINAAMQLAAKNQRMYVISVGADASKDHLQQMANLGAGLPQMMTPGATVYYPEDPAALADTLATLIGQELSCDLALEGKGVVESMACSGEVTLNGQPLECGGANGWALKDKTHITLQGTACDTFKMGADALLDASFPCEALVVD